MGIKTKTVYNKKTITIRQDQKEFIKEKSLNLSRFVQAKLDDYKKKSKK